MPLSVWMLLSAVVTLATAPLIGLFDGAAYEIAGDDATISRVSQRCAWAYPPYQWSVCYLLAALCGHLFTTRPCEPPLSRWLAFALLILLPYAVAVAAMVVGLTRPGGLPLVNPARVSPLAPIVLALLLGAVVGAELLHQTGD